MILIRPPVLFDPCAATGINCADARYRSYFTFVGVAAAVWAVAVPVLFIWLLHRFEDRGHAGDKVVRDALGWAYEPFRYGKSWWLIAEMIRTLILTSTIGFMSSSCHVKLLVALIISFVFTTVFVFVRPVS